MVQLVLILDNLRSAHNVGAILRTADATGVKRVIMIGITPYPRVLADQRDPVIIKRNTRAIAKTALGAELTLTTEHVDDIHDAIAICRAEKRTLYGLEQAPGAANLLTTELAQPAALIVGSEVDGISQSVLAVCDLVLQIPQCGEKESLNAAVAASIAMYRFVD